MKIQLIDFGGRSPESAHANDAGADVFSPKDAVIRPGDICKLPLGFGLKIPDGYAGYIFPRSGLVLCQDLVQVKMRNFSHFNPPEAQPQCVFFHTIVRIHLVTYSYNGYEFVSYCRKLPDIRKSSGMLAYNHGF